MLGGGAGGHREMGEEEQEALRMGAMRSLGNLDDYERELTLVARAAMTTFDSTGSAITLVSEDKEWVVASEGPPTVKEQERQLCFGHLTISQPGRQPLVILDTLQDPRVSNFEVVAEPSKVRFYAGAPLLLTYHGQVHCVGTLCVWDSSPRSKPFETVDKELLKTLATACVREIECFPQRFDGVMTPTHVDGWLEARVSEMKSYSAFARRRVDEGCIRLFAQKLRARIVHAGDYLTRAGDVGDTLFFISRGLCVCKLNGVELERLSNGHCFGETSLLSMCKLHASGTSLEQAKKLCIRNADVVAIERCELLELQFDDAWPLLKKTPNLWFTLEDMANRRIQSMSRATRTLGKV